MMLLLLVGPLVKSFDKACPLPSPVMQQFKHGWECFTLWDIIMPLFIFMCGAAIPLALPKKMENGKAGKSYWLHVAKRFALLWFFGMIVQGNLLSLDPLKIGPFSNTLQAIAVGYAVVAVLLLLPRWWMRVVLTFLLFVSYGAIVHFTGDYTPEGNITAIVESKIFSAILPAGSVWLKIGYYTWILPSMMFVAMTLCGFHATEILQLNLSPKKRALSLFAYALALLGAGFIAGIWIPVIKPIYTISFTLQAMGWSVLALAVLYVFTDILQFRSHLSLVILFGRHCLFAYMVLHIPLCVAFNALANYLATGIGKYFGSGVQAFVSSILICLELILALKIWDRLRSLPYKAQAK
jgi:predicted acyltransferase